MFKIENCEMLHVPIVVIEDDSDLNLDYFKLANSGSNVTLFDVTDQSSLQFTNSEITNFTASEALIRSNSSIISFNDNTTINCKKLSVFLYCKF